MPMKNHPHPGRIVRQDFLEPLGLTVTGAAKVLGVARQTMNNLVNEKAGKVGAVIAVSPFGAPLEIAPWRDLQEQTGMPVVVDAAAGFDTAGDSPIPQVVSLHATKILGAGEGGFVATADPELRLRLVA